MYVLYTVSLVSASLATKNKGSSVDTANKWYVDTANKVCCAYTKYQSDLYAQCALYPVCKTGSSFEVWFNGI